MGNRLNSAKRMKLRLQIGLVLTVLGFVVFLIGAAPALIGQDRSPVMGFIQIAVLCLGLGVLCLGGTISLMWLWNGRQLSIAADFGWRLVWTGYIIAIWSAMADLWGFGTSSLPRELCFGPWQERGVLAGQFVIAAGFLLLIPWKRGDAAETPPPESSQTDEEKLSE